MMLRLLVVILVSSSVLGRARGIPDLHPVVLVPGDGGSQLEARLNKTSVVHYVCEKTTKDFYSLWLNIELLVPIIIDCWIDNMKLVYNNVTRTTTDAEGVEIRVPMFGDPFPVEWLDPSQASAGAYFKGIGNALVALGYQRNVSLRGAPYDFRKGPNEQQDYFSRVAKLIEETYELNGNKSVVLIVHSMGAPMMHTLLTSSSQKWKDKYIRSLVSLCGAYAGSVKALKVYLVGDDLGSYVLRASVVKEEQITSPSLAWLLPSPSFWAKDEVLVQTDTRNYTVSNLKDFFTDIDFKVGWEFYKDMQPFIKGLPPPGVEVHCLHGTGVPTVSQIKYKPKDFPLGNPILITDDDGDGTVNRRSLQACLSWDGKQSQKVFHQEFPGHDHMQILSRPDPIAYIVQMLSNLPRHKD